ncbi:MAG: glycosyltransferase family 4 protein [Acidobacteria bacterium]|nr:glycosyltransferase family 4 protein [Acidobacteriota bacterium]
MAAPSVVVSSPSLRARGLEVARGLREAGLLREFVTTLGWNRDSRGYRLARAFGGGVGRELERRCLPSALDGCVHAYGWREAVRVATHRLTRNEVWTDRVWWWAERGYDRHVARRWAGRVPCIYGFELSSLETFRAQKRAGGRCVLAQPIAHYRTLEEILREERRKFPEAATEYDRHLEASLGRVNSIKEEELALADLVVAQSDYVAETLRAAGVAAEKIVSLPSAAPPVQPPRPEFPRDQITLLSAGSQSLRKGTHYLLQAWRSLKNHGGLKLWMVGNNTLPAAFTRDLPGEVWVSPAVPKPRLLELYRTASVLVLPTLAEGFAYVVLEAMAAGLPIITTRNSGCGSFVQDGVNGWLVPAGDAPALAERLRWCAANTDRLPAMGEASRQRAARWTWDDFVAEHNRLMREFVESGQIAAVEHHA